MESALLPEATKAALKRLLLRRGDGAERDGDRRHDENAGHGPAQEAQSEDGGDGDAEAEEECAATRGQVGIDLLESGRAGKHAQGAEEKDEPGHDIVGLGQKNQHKGEDGAAEESEKFLVVAVHVKLLRADGEGRKVPAG